MIKRTVDVIVAATLLVLILPVLCMIACAVRVKLGTPVIFSQERPGQNGRIFRLYKFRTMTNARDIDGTMLPDHQRLTSFGKFLRATSLDELPEFWNVLRGDMSLVGPRPLLVEYLERYTPEQARRHEVRPGITGLAQVSGRNALAWDERFALDVWYVDNHSMLLDLKILASTVWKALGREGVSSPGHATMPEFQGATASEGDARCDS